MEKDEPLAPLLSPDEPQTNEPIVETRPEPKPQGPWLARILVVLFAVAAAATFKWWRYDYTPAIRHYNNQLHDLDARIDSLRADIGAVGGKDAQTATLIAGLQREQKSLARALVNLSLQKPNSVEDLALAEVEFLVATAQHRLDLAQDVPMALTALETADGRLRRLDRPDLKSVREQLVKDINSLRAVPMPDIAGIALYLGDIIGRSDDLPFKAELAAPAPVPQPVQSSEIHTWTDLAGAIWKDLVNLVSIKEMDTRDPFLFDAAFRRLVQQHLRLDLFKARLDVLHRDTKNLRATIEGLSAVLARYYDTDAETVSSLLAKLKELRALDLKPSLPDISGSIRAIRDYIVAQKRGLPVPTENARPTASPPQMPAPEPNASPTEAKGQRAEEPPVEAEKPPK
ncbi:MAG: uroporphyrinogen-III C-methyltransferase [Gammaproteobacteria bacterium]